MNAICDKKIRFSDAVFALDTTPKSLRKWMQNPDFELIADHPEGEWKSFSYADIACLAIMRKLVDFCVGVAEANRVAREIVVTRLGPLIRSKNMPPEALNAVFQGFVLAAWKSHDEWKFTLLAPDSRSPDESAVLIVHLSKVVRTACRRAIESIVEGDAQ